MDFPVFIGEELAQRLAVLHCNGEFDSRHGLFGYAVNFLNGQTGFLAVFQGDFCRFTGFQPDMMLGFVQQVAFRRADFFDNDFSGVQIN